MTEPDIDAIRQRLFEARWRREQSVMQDDLAALLRALDISDHARPTSPHHVMVDEVIPAVARVTAERDALRFHLTVHTHEYQSQDPHDDHHGCMHPSPTLSYLRCGREPLDPIHQTPAVVLARVAAEGGAG